MENSSDIRHDEEIFTSQPISFPSSEDLTPENKTQVTTRPPKHTGQRGNFRSIEEIDAKYRHVFSYPYFNLVQSRVIDDALYSSKSMVVCAPTGSGKTVIFEMAILQLLMEREDRNNTDDFKIIYMAPVKALCTERITEWYSKFNKLGLLCIEVTGDTDVDFTQLKPYRIIITTPEKWDMVTRWMEHDLVRVVKLFLIDEVHLLNDEARGPVLEAVVTRMKTVESSVRSGVRLVAVSATISNPQDVAAWLGAGGAPAVHYSFGEECRPVPLTRVVEGYPCSGGTSIFKFDIILNYKLWPVIQKYHNGKPTLIFCNTRKSVMLTAETLSREVTVSFTPDQRGVLTALASTIKNKKIQSLILSGVGCHHAGLLLEERASIEQAFRNRDLPILITTTTLAMGVNLPAHLVIIKNTQHYVNGAYQEYSISTVLQMVGRAGRPQYDTHATAVIMTRLQDKARYQSMVGGTDPLQSFLHKRLPETINSEIALGTIRDLDQCVSWISSTFLMVRAAADPGRYLGLTASATPNLITNKIEELCVKALNGLERSGLVTMDELSCVESTEAGRLMSLHYLDLETMKLIMKIEGTESLERLLWMVCESAELSDIPLRVGERGCLNTLNRSGASCVRYPVKGRVTSRQMKINCIIQSVLGCLPIPDPSLNQEALKIMRTADRVCKCLVSYVTRPNLVSQNPKSYTAMLNSLILSKCVTARLWENSLYVSRQLRGIGPTFSTLLSSAGKTNFMILNESHPRDLERIMNKGPPAGNILRKQISLLPKYNITIAPINKHSVRVQLLLLNQSHLAENVDTLTAGAKHKSYIIVGDSENILLYFSSFTDSELINIYDGTMSFEVTRKHLHEHKVFAHCISSSFVGIDDQCEYIFEDSNPFPVSKPSHNQTPQKINSNRQTYITDVFKERKRKNNDNDSTNNKEKKKRENLLIYKFKTLNESFEKTAKDIKGKCNDTKIIIGTTPNRTKPKPQDINAPNVPEPHEANEIYELDALDDFDCEDIDNERINNLLNEIEDEFNKPSTSKIYSIGLKDPHRNTCNSKTLNRDKVNKNTKNNYTFIDKLEKKNSEYDNDNLTNNKESEFSNTIKCQVQQYLQKAQNKINCSLIKSPTIQNKELDSQNPSSESKEIVHRKVINPHVDLTKSVEVKQNITKTDVSRENVVIDLINKSPREYNRIKKDTAISSPNTKTSLENNEFNLIQIQNQKDANTTNTNKIKCTIEDNSKNYYSLMPYVPEVISPKPISNTPKQETLETTNSSKVQTSSDLNYNLKQLKSFSADCSLIPYEKKFGSHKPINAKELKTIQKSFNIYKPNIKDDLSESNLLSIDSEENHSDIDITTQDPRKYFKDIKKYSFSAIKTIGVHKENISKICTLKVALDVTEIVHHDNKYTENDSTNVQNVFSNLDNVDTVLQIEQNKKNMQSLNITSNENNLLTKQLQINKRFNEIPDKSIDAQVKKETTLQDILDKFNKNDKRQNDLKGQTIDYQTQINKNNPEYKPRRKYRISDIDTIDITLPESLVPSQSQITNKVPVNLKTNESYQHRNKSINEATPKPSTIIENITPVSDITSIIDTDDDEELKIDLNSDLDEPIVLNFDLNPPLLDPKTLLQSVNSEEIIPPPPEFCDNISSPTPSPDLNTSIVTDFSYNESNDANTHEDSTFAIFEDDLRSSTDTNTWVLSKKDDHLCTPNSIYNTTVHRNHIESNRSDNLNSRLCKLSQFKFKRNNMLRK